MKCIKLGVAHFRRGRPPHGGRGLKSLCLAYFSSGTGSPSPRRAWIEIPLPPPLSARAVGGRPPHGGRGLKCEVVEGIGASLSSPSPRRAWIEIFSQEFGINFGGSPSPRRAWIEIMKTKRIYSIRLLSPSPRRAWIEIKVKPIEELHRHVALPTEGVD